MENCFSYSDNILQMRDSERCVALTFASVRKHLHDSNIHFSYLIKKKSDKTPIPPSSSLVDATASDSKTIPKQAPYQPPNKGIMKANVVRKGSSIPTGSMAPKKVEMAADPPLICLEVTEPGNTTRPAEYSSINKFHYDQMFKSPGKIAVLAFS